MLLSMDLSYNSKVVVVTTTDEDRIKICKMLHLLMALLVLHNLCIAREHPMSPHYHIHHTFALGPMGLAL